jgi:hypothetical protein
VSISLTFRAVSAGSTVNNVTVTGTDENGALLGGNASAPATITQSTIPVNPVPTEPTTVTQTLTTTTLPHTGDNLSIFLTLAWILIPLGLLLMMMAYFVRRRNARGVEVEQ